MEHIAEVLNLTCGTAYRLCNGRRLIVCSILRTCKIDRESVSKFVLRIFDVFRVVEVVLSKLKSLDSSVRVNIGQG